MTVITGNRIDVTATVIKGYNSVSSQNGNDWRRWRERNTVQRDAATDPFH